MPSTTLSMLAERLGEPLLLASGGALIGLAFGYFAQRSRFCLRAATVEFWRRQPGDKLAVWLLAFAAAVCAVQAISLVGWFDASTARQLSVRGSLSGAAVGGLMFGLGMVLARGCASRLLVLAANGNLRALLSGLIFAVTAQASLAGALMSPRLAIASWWTIEGGPARDLLARLGAGHGTALVFGLLWLAAGLLLARRGKRIRALLGGQAADTPPLPWRTVAQALACGAAVAAAWWFTFAVASNSFAVVNVQGLTFSAPAAEWLMRVLAQPSPPWGFDSGLAPGVFAGSLLAALLAREWKLEGFSDGYSMRRYIAGAMLMGFGAMLAGGCAVGAGVTGGAIFALTAWVSLVAMWLGAGLADWLLDRPVEARTRVHAGVALLLGPTPLPAGAPVRGSVAP